MSNSRRKPNKSVYLRRRIIALVALAAVIAIIWSLVAAMIGFVQGLTGGTPAPASNGVVSVAACDANKISIVPVVADSSGGTKAAFDTGANPFFGYKITNIGDKDCSFDVGAKDTFYKVTSGSETIWTSTDCDRTGLVSTVITIKAGETKTSAISDWFRVKSSSTGCGAEQTPVTAGGASYHLTVEVGGAVSANTSQFILN